MGVACSLATQASEAALRDAFLLAKPGDTVTAFHSLVLEEQGATAQDTADSYFETLLKKAEKQFGGGSSTGVKTEYVAKRHGGTGPAADILAFIDACEEEEGAD